MDLYFTFASRGRNDWWRYLLTPILALVLTVLAGVVVTLLFTFLHLLPSNIAAQIQQPKDVAPFYLGVGFYFGLLTAGLAVAAAIVQRKQPRDIIGLWRWKFFFLGLAVWTAVQGGLALIDLAIAPGGFAVTAGPGTVMLAAVALAGVAIQTFAEEFIFRGYLTQGILLALKKPLPTAIVSGLLFGSLHIPNGVPQALNAVLFGIVCALIAMRTGGIALTSGLHLANNYFGAVVVVSASDVFKGSPGIVSQNTPQLIWWDLGLGSLALIGAVWLIFRRTYFSIAPAG
jgi:membrane protease YdiL (CAAX protease family)